MRLPMHTAVFGIYWRNFDRHVHTFRYCMASNARVLFEQEKVCLIEINQSCPGLDMNAELWQQLLLSTHVAVASVDLICGQFDGL